LRREFLKMNNQLSAEQVLKEKGFIMITTAGVSMRPLLRDRCDRVIIKPISQPLKKYDVPLYRRGEELVLHRILKIEGDTLIIRGDNCVNLEYVDVNNVIGVLTEFYRGNKHYSFPTAKSLTEAGENAIFALKTGFRAKYIFDAATRVENGEINLKSIYEMNLDDAMQTLMKIKGVGPKVASCVLLFGFSKYDAFPIDVWVKRILANYYSEGMSPHFTGKYAGIAQQYLFYYERCKNNVYL